MTRFSATIPNAEEHNISFHHVPEAHHALHRQFLGERLGAPLVEVPAPPHPWQEPAFRRRCRLWARAAAGASTADTDRAAAAAAATTTTDAAHAAGVRVPFVPIHGHPAFLLSQIKQLLQVKNIVGRCFQALPAISHCWPWRHVRSRLLPKRDCPFDVRARVRIHELHVHLNNSWDAFLSLEHVISTIHLSYLLSKSKAIPLKLQMAGKVIERERGEGGEKASQRRSRLHKAWHHLPIRPS